MPSIPSLLQQATQLVSLRPPNPGAILLISFLLQLALPPATPAARPPMWRVPCPTTEASSQPIAATRAMGSLTPLLSDVAPSHEAMSQPVDGPVALKKRGRAPSEATEGDSKRQRGLEPTDSAPSMHTLPAASASISI